MYNSIVRREDGSYVVTSGDFPRHIPNHGFWAEEWSAVDALAKEHPELVTDEEPPSPPSLEEVKTARLAEVNAAYDEAVSALVSTYPASELITFDKQEAEARAWLADSSARTPLIDALVLGRGIDKAELVRRIVAKAEAFAVATGYLTGQRQRFEDLLDAATTAEEVEAIVPEYKLPEV